MDSPSAGKSTMRLNLFEEVARLQARVEELESAGGGGAPSGGLVEVLLAGVTVPVLVLDAAARVTQANRAACELLALGLNELIGRRASDLLRGLEEALRQGVSTVAVSSLAKPGNSLRADLRGVGTPPDVTTVVTLYEPADTALLETLPVILWTTDAELRLCSLSGGSCRDLGLQASALIGEPLPRWSADGRPDFAPLAEHERALAGAVVTYAFEWEDRTYRAHVAPRRGDEGKVAGCTGLAVDATARRLSDELFRAMFSGTPESVLIHDDAGQIIRANVVAARRLGMAADELVGRNLNDLVAPGSPARVTGRGRDTLGGLGSRFETAYLSQDGQRIEVEVSECPIRIEGSIAILSVARDITERKRSTTALIEREQQLRALFENAPLGIEMYDADGQVLRSNAAALSIYDDDGSAGSANLSARVNLREGERRKLLQGQAVTRSVQLELGPGDQDRRSRVRHVEAVIFPTFLLDKTIRGFFGLYEDVTERRLADEALRRASRLEATATLSGGIAHDFNNLMVGVLGNAELLGHMLELSGTQDRLLNSIIDSAQQAGSLARQLLSFSRGGMAEPQVMNLNDTVHEALSLERHATRPEISVHLDLDGELWNVRADPTQMSQVIMNLLINAAEAISGEGWIRISTANVELSPDEASRLGSVRAGRHARLTIEDNGSGMPPEVLERVFEPFFTTKFQGRGLGLASIYGIIRGHEGHIAVTSEVGHGSTFDIYLPGTEAPQEGSKPEEDDVPHGTETVLVVDDEEPVRFTTRMLLEHLGYTVLTARDGTEALEVLTQHTDPIQLAILDLGMPRMGGSELFPLLRERRPDVKVLICSGYDLEGEAAALLEKGASGFVAKPFRLRAVGLAVRKALDS